MTSASRWLQPMLRTPGDVLAVLWGFAEATLFFIVPDVFMTLVALFSPRRGVRAMLLTTIGALVGGIAMFAWSSRSPAAQRIVANVPFVSDQMMHAAASEIAESGATAMLRGPMRGVPYKVYAVEAPGHVNWLTFIAISVPARLERFVITVPAYAVIGWLLRRQNVRSPWLIAVWLAHWLIVYTIYWSALSHA